MGNFAHVRHLRLQFLLQPRLSLGRQNVDPANDLEFGRRRPLCCLRCQRSVGERCDGFEGVRSGVSIENEVSDGPSSDSTGACGNVSLIDASWDKEGIPNTKAWLEDMISACNFSTKLQMFGRDHEVMEGVQRRS